MTAHDSIRKTFGRIYDTLLLNLAALALFISPWFYGLTRYRDQLVAQIVIFAFAILALLEPKRNFFYLKRGLIPGASGLKKIENPGRRGTTETVEGMRSAEGASIPHLFMSWLSIDFFVALSLLLSLGYVFISSVSSISIFAFMQFLSICAFYFLIRGLVTDESRFCFFLRVIFLTGVFYSVYGLFQYYGYLSSDYWYQPGFLASRLVNGGHFAAFLLMPIFIGIVLCDRNKNFLGRLLYVLLIFVMVWTLVLTKGRTAWGAFGLGMGFLLFLGFFRRDGLSFPKILGTILTLLAGGALLVKIGALNLINERINELIHVGGERNFYNLFFRLELWEGCLRAIWVRPWGWGIGAFSTIFPMFRVNDDRFFIDYAHNELLQIGVDLGILGFALSVFFIGFYFFKALSSLKNPAESIPRKLSSAVLGMIFLGLLIASLTDFPLRIYSNALFFSAFLSLSAFLFGENSLNLNNGEGGNFKSKKSGKIIVLAAFVALFAGLSVSARHLFGQMLYEQGVRLEGNYKFQKALDQYHQAAQMVPYRYDYQFSLGNIFRKTAVLSFDKEKRSFSRRQAVDAFSRALKLNPFSAEAYYYLALVEEELEQPERAAAAFKKAIRLAPVNGFYLLEYGYFSLRHQMLEQAVNAFEEFSVLKFREYPGGDSCAIVKKCAEQISDYGLLKRTVPDYWLAHYCLGSALIEKEQWNNAGIEFEKYLIFGRKNYELSYYQEHFRAQIASLYVSKGRIQDALGLYEKDLQSNPNDSIAIAKIKELENKLTT